MSKKNETELALLAAIADALREQLLASNEPRRWELWFDSQRGDDAIVSPDEVKDRLEEAAAYGYEGTETQWVTCEARCRSTGEIVTAFVTLDPEEPECTEGRHDWQTPWKILGGLKENPGVLGHGGGIIAERVCMHCGCAEVTDTWAQNPYDGTQGLTSVEYEAGRYREEVEALKQESDDEGEDDSANCNV